MTIKTSIDPKAGVATHRVTGEIDMEQIRQAWDKLLAHPDFDPAIDVLWDLSACSRATLNSRDIERIRDETAAVLERRQPGYKVALVAPKDLYFGLCRMFEAYADDLPIKVHVFRKLDDAWRWLTGEDGRVSPATTAPSGENR